MAITITKRGQLPEDVVYVGKCHYCKTEMTWKGADGKVSYDQRDGDSNSVECPLCKRQVYGCRVQ